MNWLNKLAAAAAAAFIIAGAALAQEGRGDVVYVPTPQFVVEEMLAMAKIGPKDFLVDLGSGDGRFVITAAKKFGARGIGVDLDTYLLGQAWERANREGVGDRAKFVEENLFETDLSKATVISTYLLPEMNLKLRPKILALRPGTRVVAHDYHFGEWLPDAQKDIPVPEKVVGTPGVSYIYLWIVPARVAGKWQAQVRTAGQAIRYEIDFDQSFQVLEGTLRSGSASTRVFGKVKGEQVSFATLPGGSPGGQRHEFSGRISGDTMKGTVRIGEGTTAKQSPFSAKLTVRRELKRASDEVQAD